MGVYATNLTEELVNLGHEVHVLAPLFANSKKYETVNGVTIHRINIINKDYLQVLSFWLNLSKQFREINNQVGGFDVVNGNQLTDLLLSSTGVPHVVTMHSLSLTNAEAENLSFLKRLMSRGENSLILELIEKSMVNNADIVIANSQYMKRSMLRIYGLPEARIQVIYPGITINPMSSIILDKEKTLRHSLNLGNNFVILFVGRLVLRKGLHFLLSAFGILKKRLPNVSLVVIGDGPERQRYLNQVKSMSLEKDVIFTGFVDKQTIGKIYSLSDIVAIPSLNEPFGIVVLEAMLFRKPIVGSNSGAFPEILQNNVNGQLIDPKDAFKFADALEKYLKNQDLSEKIGRLNREKVIKEFSWTKTAERTIEVYKMVV